MNNQENSYGQWLCLLVLYYTRLLAICDVFAGNYIVSTNNKLNYYYIVISTQIDEILKRKEFEKLKEERPELFDNLSGNLEFYNIEWEELREVGYQYLTKIQKEHIKLGAPTFIVPAEFQSFIENIDKEILEHKNFCDKRWNQVFKRTDGNSKSFTRNRILFQDQLGNFFINGHQIKFTSKKSNHYLLLDCLYNNSDTDDICRYTDIIKYFIDNDSKSKKDITRKTIDNARQELFARAKVNGKTLENKLIKNGSRLIGTVRGIGRKLNNIEIN